MTFVYENVYIHKMIKLSEITAYYVLSDGSDLFDGCFMNADQAKGKNSQLRLERSDRRWG